MNWRESLDATQLSNKTAESQMESQPDHFHNKIDLKSFSVAWKWVEQDHGPRVKNLNKLAGCLLVFKNKLDILVGKSNQIGTDEGHDAVKDCRLNEIHMPYAPV